MFLGACFSGAVPTGWDVWYGAPTPCSSRRSTGLERSFPTTGGGVFSETMSPPLLSISKWSLYPLLWRSSSSSFHFFFRGKWSMGSYRFAESIWRLSSGSSYAAICDTPPYTLYFILIYIFTLICLIFNTYMFILKNLENAKEHKGAEKS